MAVAVETVPVLAWLTVAAANEIVLAFAQQTMPVVFENVRSLV